MIVKVEDSIWSNGGYFLCGCHNIYTLQLCFPNFLHKKSPGLPG
jgi:hypothetical protein